MGNVIKSQDILILLMLICLDQARKQVGSWIVPPDSDWSARGLAALTGVNKTEVNASLNRSIDSGLAIVSSADALPRSNSKALPEFIVYGIKYVFPVKPAELIRGIPTVFAAPILKKKLMGGDIVPVWPDAASSDIGQSVSPLYKTVPQAT